ncbi:hypothetical protein POM88_020725 [Heracleum sosnowskyi]|uniref:Uncharacterized protein n=1 Tax=Heracleum sosnowskyi TaxID=360622 RepID=A0AAD8IFL9_9APIA|nr:hypothetical protein POM88_020725 [Heracleum sosnowskyi]
MTPNLKEASLRSSVFHSKRSRVFLTQTFSFTYKYDQWRPRYNPVKYYNCTNRDMDKSKMVGSSAGGLGDDSGSGGNRNSRSKPALVKSDSAGNENRAPPSSSTKVAKKYTGAVMDTSCHIADTTVTGIFDVTNGDISAGIADECGVNQPSKKVRNRVFKEHSLLLLSEINWIYKKEHRMMVLDSMTWSFVLICEQPHLKQGCLLHGAETSSKINSEDEGDNALLADRWTCAHLRCMIIVRGTLLI